MLFVPIRLQTRLVLYGCIVSGLGVASQLSRPGVNIAMVTPSKMFESQVLGRAFDTVDPTIEYVEVLSGVKVRGSLEDLQVLFPPRVFL